ncbi:unnamed protein product, partial [Symbiodinium necroappetens]
MAQLLQDQLLDMGAKPLPQDLARSNVTVAAARAAAGWQSNKRVLPLVSEFKHVVHVSGTFDASFVQSLHVGSKLAAEWTVPATSTATPCYVASVPSGSKVLRILTKPGESAEDANSRAGHSKPACPCLQPPSEDSHPAEKCAYGMCQQSRPFGDDEFRTFLDMLPMKQQKRGRGDTDDYSNQFLCGAYAHGPMIGCKNLTREMPWCAAVLCRHVRERAPGFPFSAVGFLFNVKAKAHRDLHNEPEPGTKNLVMATHACSGGGLWLEDAGGRVAVDVGQGCRVGKNHTLAVGRPFTFEPRKWHATQLWRGDRGIVVAYTPAGVTRLGDADSAFLQGLGFPLRCMPSQPTAPEGSTGTGGSADAHKGSLSFGVYHAPQEFVAKALSEQHPCHLESLLPAELVQAIRVNHSKSAAVLGQERTETLRKWVERASELSADEEQLKNSFSPHRQKILHSKRLLLMKEMLDSVGHEDEDLVSDLSTGFDLTGPLPRSHVFRDKYRPAAMAEETLRKSARIVRGQVLGAVKSSGDEVVDQGVLAATEKELAKGFVEGPVPESSIPPDGTITHRFGVVQGQTDEGPKIRPIDNYLSSLVNAVVSQSEQDSFFVIFCPKLRKHVIYKQRVMPFGAKVLGIKIDTSEARLGMFKMENTLKRVNELVQSLDAVLASGKLSHSECEKLRGRLQFASGQLFGRRAKVALHQLSRHHGGRLGESSLEACRFLRDMISSNKSRVLSRQLGNTVHVYVDASFSDEGRTCGIGGMAYDKEGTLLQ